MTLLQLPGEQPSTALPARRRFLVPLPPELDAAALEHLGDLVHPGRIQHLEIEAESRVEARELAAELVADAVTR